MKCWNCFQEIAGQQKCPFCGHENTSEPQEPHYIIPGTRIGAGRYLVGTSVGAGGFGVTYAAWDEILNQRVAIKEYLPGEFSTRLPGAVGVTVYGGEKEEQFHDGLRKFCEEARRLAKFREVPGIVQIYDCFEENETGYIIMEFLEGETLAERLKEKQRLPYEEVVQIMLPILDALTVIHQDSMLHRDIAPNNIFLCSDGGVKLLDFGAARNATGTHSKSLTVLYKEGYTAEEQYRSHGDQGSWTDVYALAATMYKAITGERPEGAMERRRKDTLKAPAQYRGVKISNNVNHAIMNALNIDMAKRTQSADAFKKELLSDKNVANHFHRTWERKVGRIPGWAIGLTGTAVVTAGVLIGLLAAGVITFDMESFADLFLADGKARVINVVNMEDEEARERLSAIGLDMEISEYQYSKNIAEGMIVSQEENKGEIVDEGSVIHVTETKIPSRISVPEMVGDSLEDAEEKLTERNLLAEIEYVESLEYPDIVLEQDKKMGSAIWEGDTVTLTVSSGLAFATGQSVTVPDLSGQTYEEARETMAQIGVYLAQEEEREYSDEIDDGGVMKQDVESGQTMLSGETVTVTISKGKEPVYTPNLVGMDEATATSTCTTQGYNYTIEYYLGGDGSVISQSPESTETIEPGDNIAINVGVSQSVFSEKLLVLINEKRAANGAGALSFSDELNQACAVLAAENVTSTDLKRPDGSGWSTALNNWSANYQMMLYTTRNNITGLTDAASRLKYADNSYGATHLLTPEYEYIGMAYSSSNMLAIIVAEPW